MVATMSKKEARYVPKALTALCRNCSMYVRSKGLTTKGKCTLVKGEINPNGHCLFFEAK